MKISLNSEAEKAILDALQLAGEMLELSTLAKFKLTGLSLNLAGGISSRIWRNGYGVYTGLKKDYRLNFFENGTKPRKTKLGKNRGQILPYHFFANAVNETLDKAIDRVEKTISENDLFERITIYIRGKQKV